MATAATAAVSGAKAGFWIRFAAIFIDGIILAIITSIINLVFNGNVQGRGGIQTILGIVYYAYFWSSNSPWPGQTLGNKILNIRVVKTDGSDLTIVQALIRYVGLFVSVLCLGIGVIWAAFDPNKQGWHDKIAGTYVIKTA